MLSPKGNGFKPAIGSWVGSGEKSRHAAMLREQSGKTLSVLDRREDEMSHGWERTAQKIWRSKHGANPVVGQRLIVGSRMSLSSAVRCILGMNRTLTKRARRGRITYRKQVLCISLSRALGGAAGMEANRGELPMRCNLGRP